MRIFRMFAYLCLSGLLVLNGCLHVAKAEENYGISTLSVLSENYLGYVGFYNSGYDEWDYVINYIKGLNLDSYDGYIIRSDSNGDIDILYDFSRWDSSDGSAYFSKIGTCVYSIADKTYECSSRSQSNYHVFEQAPLFAMKLNQPSYWSNIVNWNAVGVSEMIEIYESGITDETQAIIDTINGQWGMDESDNLGIDSLVPEVEDKLGVLGFASDTLIQFVDLFNPSNANGTTLTFPGFSINVDGVSYQVWNDVSYDLNTLYQDFSFLIDTVRTILSLFVWIAVFNYLVKEYERFVNG